MGKKWIVLEGCDGVGKSTQVQMLSDYLRNQGVPNLKTRSPGQTLIGQQIREMILQPPSPLTPWSQLGMFLADLSQLYSEVIEPFQEGIIVQDRWWYSIWSYQSVDLPSKKNLLFDLFMGAFPVQPDLVIYLDLPLSESRMQGKDSIESRGLDFQEEVYKNYSALSNHIPFVRMNVSGLEREGVHSSILSISHRLIHPFIESINAIRQS